MCLTAFFLQQKEGTRYNLHISDKKRGRQESGSTQKRQPSELHYVLGSQHAVNEKHISKWMQWP